MSRKVLLFAVLAVFVAACDRPPDAETTNRTLAELTSGSCSGVTTVNHVDVTAGGVCTRYAIPAGNLWTSYYVDAGGATITAVSTGLNAAAWVCDSVNPIGVSQSPWAPCWRGGIYDIHQRIRGAVSYPNYAPWVQYAAASATITAFAGKSVVVSLGHLVGPPSCPWLLNAPNPPQAFNFHDCHRDSDSGLEVWTANADPTDSTTCCQESGNFPDGSSGAPCLGYGGDRNYATVVYGC